MSTVADIGEFGLIFRIKEWVKTGDPRVVRGIGDDTAVLKGNGGKLILFTCDVQVEGVHFLLSHITPYELGRKSLAINISDIASMGGYSTFALISLILSPDTEIDSLKEFYQGLEEEAGKWGVSLVGGNISKTTGPIVVDIALLGEVEEDNLKFRSGARPDDLVLITGEPGRSAAGLRLMHRCLREKFPSLVSAHLTPVPRVREARLISGFKCVTSMIDVSDGVLKDLYHILEESSVGAVLREESFQISEELREASLILGEDPLSLFLSGGEDYELIFTVSPEEAPVVKKKVEEAGTPVSIIGEINSEAGNVALRRRDGSLKELSPSGWDHFAKGGCSSF